MLVSVAAWPPAHSACGTLAHSGTTAGPLGRCVGSLLRCSAAASTERGLDWRELLIGGEEESGSVVESVSSSRSVVVVPSLLSGEECDAIVEACARIGAEHRAVRLASGLPVTGLVRLPVADALPGPTQAACDALLLRAMAFIDSTLPALVRSVRETPCPPEPRVAALYVTLPPRRSAQLYDAPSLCELHADGQLEFSSREPAVNVYTEGGEFLAHKDHQALTVLVPLSSSERFDGGGTGFWSQDARGHRVERPSTVLRPEAGTAMLWGGHVTHAGMPVTRGERVVFVASFSARGGRERRAREAATSRDLYGDSL